MPVATTLSGVVVARRARGPPQPHRVPAALSELAHRRPHPALTQILVARLGRIALQICEFERRLDKDGKLSETEFRVYSSVSSQYTGIMRELALHRHKHPRPPPEQPPAEPANPPSSSLADILAEMPEWPTRSSLRGWLASTRRRP